MKKENNVEKASQIGKDCDIRHTGFLPCKGSTVNIRMYKIRQNLLIFRKNV